MNNEEIILSILEQIQTDVSGLKEGQANLQEGQASLQEGQASLQEGQASLQEGQASLQEGQASLQEGQARMQADISTLKEGYAELKEEVVLANRRNLEVKNDLQSLKNEVHDMHVIILRTEHDYKKKQQAIMDAQAIFDETRKQQEPRIIKLETEVDRLDDEVRMIKAAK